MLSEDMIKYRAKNRMNQRELAAKCGLSVQTVCAIETNQQTPTRVTEARIRLVIDEKED